MQSHDTPSVPACKTDRCDKPATARGLCSTHYYHLTRQTEMRLCSVTDCTEPIRTREYCNKHYTQFQRTGDPTFKAGPKPKQVCTVDGCTSVVLAKGLCNKHYLRLRENDTLNGSVRTLSDDERFLAYSGSAGKSANECWLWTGGLSSNGYGKFKVAGETVGAHVYALRRTGVTIDTGQQVRHRCPSGANKRCVNPAHLLTGTAADNVHDRDADGTTAKGEAHYAARFTENDVREMRQRRAAGEKLVDIASDYDTVREVVWAIVTYKSWKHVT